MKNTIKGLITSVALIGAFSATASQNSVPVAQDITSSNISLLAGIPNIKVKPEQSAAIPNIKFKPVQTAAIPNIKFKPVQTAAIPNIKFKPVQTAAIPNIKFFNQASA